MIVISLDKDKWLICYCFLLQPNRTYYLEDPEGYALQWCKDIEDVRLHVYGKQQPK